MLFFFRKNYLFWSDITTDIVWRSELNGSNPVRLITSGTSCIGMCQSTFWISLTLMVLADGLAWDWVNQKLYWTDYCNDDIEVYDPETQVRRVLFDVGLSEPHSIVVDPTTG